MGLCLWREFKFKKQREEEERTDWNWKLKLALFVLQSVLVSGIGLVCAFTKALLLFLFCFALDSGPSKWCAHACRFVFRLCIVSTLDYIISL